ncbi:S41 family peptidase [Altererythrobacter sp. ZODW24]|uniref:S41 family peptidase n=1 Tax=Altererythrobacter sp. ZODW24 TaxID=2185142 RepID=UPI000DF805CF|nr:S41 family peptidase [Altererythrobacter sp. ZODW24]
MKRRDILKGTLAGVAAAAIPGNLMAAASAGMSDMEVLRLALTLHPGLYRYNTPAQIEAELTSLSQAYGAASDIETRFLTLSRFLATIRCGHTQCNPYNQSKAVRAQLFDRPTRLPFHFDWFGEQMIVTADKSGTGKLIPGSRITNINGRPAAAYLTTLMPFARADGSNDGKRRSLLSVTDDTPLETFDIYQGLLFPPKDGSFDLTLVTPDGASQSLTVAAVSRVAPPGPAKEDAIFQWEMRDDGVALLSMPTWVTWRTTWDWQAWLDERLAEAAGAKGLIVDIRGNEGGMDAGNQILAALAKEDLVLDQYKPRIRYRTSPEALEPYFTTYTPEARTLGEQAVELGEGFFGYPDFVPAPRIEAAARRLDVPTAILMDPSNSSATFNFVKHVRQFGLAKLFGETSGGNLRGINGNAYFFVTLPESGIEFDLPLVGEFPVEVQPDRGINPDVTVCRRPEDIATGRDAAMEAAASWIVSA